MQSVEYEKVKHYYIKKCHDNWEKIEQKIQDKKMSIDEQKANIIRQIQLEHILGGSIEFICRKHFPHNSVYHATSFINGSLVLYEELLKTNTFIDPDSDHRELVGKLFFSFSPSYFIDSVLVKGGDSFFVFLADLNKIQYKKVHMCVDIENLSDYFRAKQYIQEIRKNHALLDSVDTSIFNKAKSFRTELKDGLNDEEIKNAFVENNLIKVDEEIYVTEDIKLNEIQGFLFVDEAKKIDVFINNPKKKEFNHCYYKFNK
ncbi:hypothetical protein [Paenibacillus thermotolerans]|uniref:hypothetical protein n=1 Tax=Paenibacillus thermotolerans TaxID=3027807 RepID=UPI002368D020|nr:MULTISPECIES: hypothetical protein [unclassified Paenibacillus]